MARTIEFSLERMWHRQEYVKGPISYIFLAGFHCFCGLCLKLRWADVNIIQALQRLLLQFDYAV